MGRSNRSRPKKMGKKLRAIRLQLGLSQTEMIKALGVKEPLRPASISGYELGQREPSLITLLAYSDLGKVTINDLVNDRVKWP
jgi:transcriptional regulator with XRE-family HTH domain